MRVTENFLRDEVLLRCIEFLDVAIHFVLYVEQIYAQDFFEKKLKYNLIVYECQDNDVQNYIFEFLKEIKPIFRRTLIDQIGLSIFRFDEKNVLRRYLFEFNPIVDSTKKPAAKDGAFYLAQLDSIFSDCLKQMMRQIPVVPPISNEENFDDEIRWKLEFRFSPKSNENLQVEQSFYDQFKLAESSLLPIDRIKSFHSDRMDLQLLLQEKSNDADEHFEH